MYQNGGVGAGLLDKADLSSNLLSPYNAGADGVTHKDPQDSMRTAIVLRFQQNLKNDVLSLTAMCL